MISKLPAATSPINMLFCQKTRPPRSVSLVSSRGFTLIELSIVVVIISMLLSLGLGVLNAQLVSAAQAETKKRQAIIKDALTAYLGANKRLPCPDIPNNTHGTTDTSQVTGGEDRAGGIPTGACSGNIGVVPYATLGLGRELAMDGWGNFMSYSVPPATGTCPDGIAWSLSDCFGAAKISPYLLFDGTAESASNVLAVVVSHGPNGFAAWGRQGSWNVLPLRCEEAHNAIAAVSGCTLTANKFYKGDRAEVDDVVAALTRDEAINALAMQGTLKSAEGQVIEDLARLRSAKLNKKVLLPDGACSTSVLDTGEKLPSDPWGKLYEIVEGDALEVLPNKLPICICSTRGSGSLPAPTDVDPTCRHDAPTTCVEINRTEVNSIRQFMGLGPC